MVIPLLPESTPGRPAAGAPGTPRLQLVKAETLRAQVENHLREAIVTGQLKPGEKLIERELCEMLGVSRPSLREALRKLEAEKLIIIVPHRGPEVAAISLQEARDLYGLRRLLESFAAQEFAAKASDEDIRRLGRAVKRLREAGLKNSRSGVLAAKAEFYDILLGGCGNQLVNEILGGLLSRVSLLRSTSLMLPDRLPRSLDEIEAMLKCIKARDAQGARSIAETHVQNAEQAALSVFQQWAPAAANPAESAKENAAENIQPRKPTTRKTGEAA